MTALVSYSTGTATVADGGTSVTGTGTIWSGVNARPGDVLQIGNFQTVISDVVDTDTLTIPPWGGGAQTGVAYKIWQVSPQRFAGAQAMADVSTLVGALNTSGFFVFVGVSETVPDPSLGSDGQYAFQPTSGKTWAKVSGAWSYLGIYKGFQIKGAWSGATDYIVGDVVTLSGSSYVCVLDHTNHTPPNTTYWQLLASKGTDGTNGSNGAAATIAVGTTTTGASGSSAAVANSGTSSAAVFNFTIPTGKSYGGTSTTSLAIGTGSKAFTTQAGLAYISGVRVRASSAANTGNWMEGVATYSGTTLTINVDKSNGSGTLADWNLNVAGEPGIDGTATLSTVDRQNILLDRIYQAKSFAGYRRFLNAFADGFKASDGVDAGNSSNYTVTTGSGFVIPSTTYTVQTPSAVDTSFTYASGGAAQANLYDGNDATLAADGSAINTATHAAYDFGSAKDIRRVRVFTAASNGWGAATVFNIQYSDTSLTAGFTSAGTITIPAGTSQTAIVDLNGAAGAHRYWRIYYSSGTTGGNGWLGELSFSTAATSNMTLVTTAQTADASVSNGRVLLEFDNATGLPTLNTDLTVEVTCNGGTNWTSATLSSVSTHGQGGRYVAETADVVCTAGTSFAARIKTLNSKLVPIYGVSLTVH